jgi:hypothetical protein
MRGLHPLLKRKPRVRNDRAVRLVEEDIEDKGGVGERHIKGYE